MKKEHLIQWATISMLFCLPGIAYAQSSKEVIKAFKKLEAKTQVGISYAEYNSILGDVNYELNTFLESTEASKNPRLKESLVKVMTCHMYAKEFFEIYVNEAKCLKVQDPNIMKRTVEWVNDAMKIYPELYGAVWKKEGDRCSQGYMSMGKALEILFQRASKELTTVSNSGSKEFKKR